jgi:dTDP-4-amino-4,6-dideoxygalactose transaminase
VSTSFIPFARPDIGEREIEAVTSVLRSGWLTTGPRAKELEAAFAREVGAPHAVAVSSCTAALHLALEALGVRAGDEVIVPTLTFAATAEVVRYLGATPVLVDVLADDHEIDPAAVEHAVTPRTKAIVPVHFAGQACDLATLLELGRSRGLHIVEDAAHAFPATYDGKPVGTHGDVVCFSFYATKTMTTGEGGMAVTRDGALAERMAVMSLHGISHDAWKRYRAEGTWYYEILAPGFKYNLTDIAAALGLVQLSRAHAMLARRGAIARRYIEAFAPLDTLDLPRLHGGRSHAWQLFVIRLHLDRLRLTRAQLIEELKQQGIGTSVHFIPLHLHPYYRDAYGYRPEMLPVAKALYERSVSLPIYSSMSDSEVERVVAAVDQTLRAFRR